MDRPLEAISFKQDRQPASDRPLGKKVLARSRLFYFCVFWNTLLMMMIVVGTWMGVMYWFTMPSMIEGRAASIADLQISSGIRSESEEQIWKESCCNVYLYLSGVDSNRF